jgi:hypothetical protein
MSRVLIPSKAAWYHELKVVSYYNEAFVERAILQHFDELFPDYYLFPFKQNVKSTTTSVTKRPDLALIRKDFTEWAVIEVEIARGKSFDHVLEQVQVFADGDYNAVETTAYICEKLKEHCNIEPDTTVISALVSSKAPVVIVIADEHRDDWKKKLKAESIEFCVFQIFKNTDGVHIYRAVGTYPLMAKRESHCRRSEIANMLEVIDPFATLTPGSNIEVIYDSCVTQWSVIEDAGQTYLVFLGKSNPLSADGTYVIIEDNLGKFHFRRS